MGALGGTICTLTNKAGRETCFLSFGFAITAKRFNAMLNNAPIRNAIRFIR